MPNNITYTNKDKTSIDPVISRYRDVDANEVKTVVNLKADISSTGNTLFVSKDGNDSTGTRERSDLPYLTIGAAVTAASSGDTIIVYPGDYTATARIPIESGINYTFLGKGTVTLGTGVTGGLFKNATSTTANCIINAPGWNFTVTDNSQVIFYQINAGETTFIFNEVNHIATTGSAQCIRVEAGTCHVRGNKVTHMGAGQCLYLTGNSTVFRGNINYIEGNNEVVLYLDRASTFLDFHTLIRSNASNTNYMVEIASVAATQIFLKGKYMYCQNGWAFYTAGASKNLFLDCDYIEGGGTCTVVGSATTGMTTVRAGIIANHRATGTYGILHAEAGPLTVIGARCERIGVVGGYDVKTSGVYPLRLIGVSYDRTLVSSAAIGSIIDENLTYYHSLDFEGEGLEDDPVTLISPLSGTVTSAETVTIDLSTMPATAKEIEVTFDLTADAAYDWRFRIERDTVGSVDSAAGNYNSTTDDATQADLTYGLMQAALTRIIGKITIVSPMSTGRLLVKTETWGVNAAGDATEVLLTNTYLTNSGALKKIQILSSGTSTGGSVDITTGHWFAKYSKNAS